MTHVRFTILILLFTKSVFASHIVGGEIYYKYLGPGTDAGTSNYEITLRLFKDCTVDCGGNTGVACLPQVAPLSIYPSAAPYGLITFIRVHVTDSTFITLTTYPACVAYKPPVCYEVHTYSFKATLADNDEGYIIDYQNCCRAVSENQYGVEFTASGVPGTTYTATIPGKKLLPAGHNNGSIFKLKDTALVCQESKFSIDFSADDADGDSLSYAFAPAYNGGNFWSDGCISTPQTGLACDDAHNMPGPPPYKNISYNTAFGFSGNSPLGANVTINPTTGLISGEAPSIPGHYIVNVVVTEWRHGKAIATHQKDFIIHVENCGIPKAKLEPYYANCNGYTLNFKNESTSPLINSYFWNFGDPNTIADTSTSAKPSYNYPDTGTYTVTLITNKGQECSYTTTTQAKVYPGFKPDFNVTGGCVFSPFQFTDRTTSVYGTVNSWKWDFGDQYSSADTSDIQNPEYTYPKVQYAQIRLIAGDSRGCLDTINKIVQVYDKPPLQLSFKDTSICLKDSIQLHATDSLPTAPVFTWSPPEELNHADIPDPIIFPTASNVYHVILTDNGCTVTDSVNVNVVPSITFILQRDTTICEGDSIQFSPITNATTFWWSPATGLNNIHIKNPSVEPMIQTTYYVKASVGSCSTSDSINIKVAPYPTLTAGSDTTICYGGRAFLFATTNGSSFTWTPSGSLLQSNTLTPTAVPVTSTAYIFTAKNINGCLKPVSDTIIVTVVPPVVAFAGNDTAIVANQPLQLNASGGTNFIWSPAIGMSDPYINNPVVILDGTYDSVTYHVKVTTAKGCSATDDIKVVVFKTLPTIFIPNAFTPNHDGLNDIIRPIIVGMKQLRYFSIYNRYGQLMYKTSIIGQGWDGNFSGDPQPVGVYVYIAQAVDFTGKVVSKKGTITLIR